MSAKELIIFLIASGLIPGLVYLFRIIPITGAGVPESLDDKHFPWVSHTIAVESKNSAYLSVISLNCCSKAGCC